MADDIDEVVSVFRHGAGGGIALPAASVPQVLDDVVFNIEVDRRSAYGVRFAAICQSQPQEFRWRVSHEPADANLAIIHQQRMWLTRDANDVGKERVE